MKGRWRHIETAPMDGTSIIVQSEHGNTWEVRWHDGNWVLARSGKRVIVKLTAWWS